MSEPNPSLIPSDDDFDKLISEQADHIKCTSAELRRLAVKCNAYALSRRLEWI